jgi:hypothetical protein
MMFKSPLWRPIAALLAIANIIAAGFAARAAEPWHATFHAVLAVGFGLWAQRLWRGAARGEGDEQTNIREQLEQQAAALEETRATLTSQATELAELQERVDFAERLLARERDRPRLGNRPDRE